MKKDNLFDYAYDVFGDSRKFYLNEEVEKVDGSDTRILLEKHYDIMCVKNRITVLNKSECGNGGTTGIVEYIKEHDTGALILVPNVSISKGKEDKYSSDPDICCVYGGVDNIDWEAKIVIATYDQFDRLLKSLREVGLSGDIFDPTIWVGRSIFVDEYHKLVDESKFREIMARLTELIIKTDLPITLMSATPHYEYVSSIKEAVGDKKEVVSINVVYKDRPMSKRMCIYKAKPSDIKEIILMFIQANEPTCIFYNNVTKISKILHDHGTDTCEILCSDSNKELCGDYYSNIYNKDKKIHIMTSGYFTGHDIDEFKGKVVIIGSKAREETALSMRDIKQMLGRFRQYCGEPMGNIHLFYINEGKNYIAYDSIEKQFKNTEEVLEAVGENWSINTTCITHKLSNLYFKDTFKRLNYWSSEEKLIKELRKNGYIVDTHIEDGKQTLKARPIGALPNYKKRKQMSYKAAYTKVANGEVVSWKDYKDIYKINEYIKKIGAKHDKDGNLIIPPRAIVFNMVKINETVENSKRNIDDMKAADRYNAFGFEDCGLYRGSYLMMCLRYVKEKYPEVLSEELNYRKLPILMKEVFDAVVYLWKKGNKHDQNIWCIIKGNMLNTVKEYTKNIPTRVDDPIYRVLPPKKYIFGINNTKHINLSIGIGAKKDGHLYAKTNVLNHLPVYLPDLRLIPLYDWVLKDKPTRLLKVKSNKSDSERWGDIKKYEQLAISEFYKDTSNEYRHTKSEVDEINSLIIDIDDSLSFKEFKELYKDWMWLAYPTISNIDSNWTKFRVIIPLEQTLKITGENNLRILKTLRAYFCPYEDANHNLYSYINKEDFAHIYKNNGEIYNIDQSEVDLLQYLISIVRDNTKLNFADKDILIGEDDVKVYSWTLEKAISYYNDHDKDNERHHALFVIKINLKGDVRNEFEFWLSENHPTKMHHWRSHKV